jgi:hypothetical protein
MITLISTPEYVDPADPSVICRWIATESPNNFRLLRRDWLCSGANALGFLQLTVADDYTGAVTNDIAVYDSTTKSMKIGKVTNIDVTLRIITTDIVWVVGTVATYLNDNSLHPNYYFEGRLTVNGIVYPLTIIASPDSFGYADLDVSGILRIVTSIGKMGDYTARIMKETTKSGKFTFEYREKWYRTPDWAAEEGWEGDVITSPMTSPPMMNTWYYGECVRSEEQGSNLHDYVADVLNDAPFLNQFDQPVYFLGLPFDLSFILPEQALVSPTSDITVTIKIYNSNNVLLSTLSELIDVDSLEGYICSLNIDPATIPIGAAYFTAEITV